MLVLTRKSKQSIMIGDNIEITVLKIERDQVRIGIAAPNSVPVHRKEVYENIQKGEPPIPPREPNNSSQPA
ncbi:MAG: carbon storage regulator CsrA [Planctomycetota bacterium]